MPSRFFSQIILIEVYDAGETSAGPLLDETFRRLIVKRRILVMVSFLGIALLLTGGLAWTAPRQPQQAASADAAKEVVLIAAVGDNTSVDQMAPDFEAKTGYKIKVTYAVSGRIKKKVIDGEPFDVAILLMPMQTPSRPATWSKAACRRWQACPSPW